MHTLILLSVAVAFFTVAMFVLYIAFIPPDVASRRLPGRGQLDNGQEGEDERWQTDADF